MGIGDIGPSLWGECEEQDGMHLGAHGFVHAELIDPETEPAIALEDGAERRARPDAPPAPRGAAAALPDARPRPRADEPVPVRPHRPRIRCIGRTDDMLIVRGVNVFPSAIREVVGGFAPQVSGHIVVRPRAPGVKQDPPLPVARRAGAGPADGRRARGGDP